ncbi:MAG: alpha/beta fold hydrolase [Chloroflexota bacterium]|nr:alpha/beta fold hydrolase [Dehalococcoidia bacterium]MDW8255093.1 alpha/beta fold hydrolase [Chloroflexota bacterium]
MATFVLVHGSFHGGWCWARVRPLLRALGHEVFTPTLTGLGDRAHAATRDTGLETHLLDLTQLLVFEDLSEVILVGHSYGCVLATALLHRVPERLAHIVYLDAGIPEEGQSAWDLFDEATRMSIRQRMAARGCDWLVPPPPLEALGITDAADAAWVAPRLTPMPLKAWTDPVRLGNPAAAAVPCSMIACTRGGARAVQTSRLQAIAARRGWPYFELESGHDAMVTHPLELSALLLAIAEQPRPAPSLAGLPLSAAARRGEATLGADLRAVIEERWERYRPALKRLGDR